MESLSGFEEVPIENEQEKSSSYSRKLVPWSTWSEWLFVNRSLFSDSPESVAAALRRISAWRSRGCLPVVVEVTASIIEIQQKDPYFRKNQSIEASVSGTEDQLNNISLSEEMLAMLYCMAIMRLVNGVVEKTRKKTEVSIAVAADVIGLPRMLIDIRHEGSHRELPALQVVRHASAKALCWLKSYYWEPQEKALPFQDDTNTTIIKEIKSRLRNLAFNLKVRQNSQLESVTAKGKRGQLSDWHCGRKKFFSLRAGKLYSSKTGGLKTKTGKTLRVLFQLYSSFSSEVVSVLLEFLLKALKSSDSMVLLKDSEGSRSTILDDWKLVITKFSNKEPALLLDLLQAILEKIETQEALGYESQHFMSSDHRMENCQIAQLSTLFAWLVDKLEGIKPKRKGKGSSGEHIPKGILMELLRKCLLVSAPGNKWLLDSAIHLAQLMGTGSLVKKLNKLSSLNLPDFHVSDGENPTQTPSENNFNQLEESFQEASQKLEMIKLHKREKLVNPIDGSVGSPNRWTVASSWTPCPIGMLPRSLGSSGRVPVLDFNLDNEKDSKELRSKENWKLIECSHKREASSDIQQLDNCTVKKIKETNDNFQFDTGDCESPEDVKGRLLIGGMWKKVGEEELSAIQSAVRILL